MFKVGHHRLVCGTPAPKDCELYYVNKDALFSYHSLSEVRHTFGRVYFSSVHFFSFFPIICRFLQKLPYHTVLLRGTIVSRTYGTQKNLYISLFLLAIFGPIYYDPP